MIFYNYKEYKKHYFGNWNDPRKETPEEFGRRLANESLLLLRKKLREI